jgi:DNA modification methylase
MKTWFAIDGTLEPIEYENPSFFRFLAELAERVLLRYSSVGEWVFDPFCDFGTTLVVAQRLGRPSSPLL